MNTNNTHIAKRRPDPFDGSAPARLAHMGLLRKDGSPETGAMAVFIRIFAGSFFDEVCDFYDNPQQIKAVLSAFSELAERADSKRLFLLLSLQYDTLRKPMPEPVWWLAGGMELLRTFTLGFSACLLELAAQANEDGKEAACETAACRPQ